MSSPSDPELEDLKSKTQHYRAEAEKAQAENEANELKFKQLKELPEEDLPEIQVKHKAMVELYLATGGEQSKAEESIQKVEEIVRLDLEREQAFLREKAELEAELNALQEQIESMSEYMTEEDKQALVAV